MLVSISKATKNDKMQNNAVLIDDAITYLHGNLMHTKNCPHLSRKKGRTNQCSCMSNFIEDVSSSDDDSASQLTQATACFIVFFAKQSCQIQQQYVIFFYRLAYQYWAITKEQNQSSLFLQHHYQIPVLCDPENGLQLNETVPYV
jgi:hypothetical protein